MIGGYRDMKKISFVLVLSILFMLGACNQNTKDDQQSKQESTNNSNETSSDQNDTSSSETQSDQNDAHTNTLTSSDEQDYQMLVLPNYSLTSEEPGKDALYASNNDAVFMRIETAHESEESYDTFKKTLNELMDAIQMDGWELEEVTNSDYLPEDESITEVVAYKIATDESTIFGYVFRRDDLLVRLTAFDTVDEQFIKDFVEMAETIQ